MGSVAGVPVSLCDCLSMEGGRCRSMEWREVCSPHPDGPHRLSPLFLPREGWSQCRDGQTPSRWATAEGPSSGLLSLELQRAAVGVAREAVCLSICPSWARPRGAGSLTGLCSGSQSGMLRLLISAVIFFRWPGLVTPMAVRS